MSVAPSRTNGFLFADLRDYTRYVEAHGDQAAAALLDAYRALVRASVAEFGGAEIKTEGDSFYVVFPSASSAVQCGLAILRAAAERTQADGAPIRVGIGVHAGETVETSEGYVGSAVNVAARVCSLAGAGELLVTDTVRALTRTFLPVRFVDRRSRRLKGIAEAVVVYRVESLAETAATGASAAARRGGRIDSATVGQRTRVTVLVLGLLIGAAASGYVLVAAQRPSVDGPATPTISAPTATFPNAVESDLLRQIPASIADTCLRASDHEALAGALATVRCDLALTADADTVWYDKFPSVQALTDALAAVSQPVHLQDGTCGPTVSRAQGNWQVGATLSGRLLCYQTEGSTWIVWSYSADRILARAVRSGDTTDSWLGLFEWWKQIRLFLQ
jgi:class 3 adenylate cyclase